MSLSSLRSARPRGLACGVTVSRLREDKELCFPTCPLKPEAPQRQLPPDTRWTQPLLPIRHGSRSQASSASQSLGFGPL